MRLNWRINNEVKMIEEVRKMFIGDKEMNVHYQLTLRDRKHIGIKITSSVSVVLLWPKRLSTKGWQQLIASKSTWIDAQLLKLAHREAGDQRNHIPPANGLWVMGRPVLIPLPEEWPDDKKRSALSALFFAVGEHHLRASFERICREVPHLFGSHLEGAHLPKLNLRTASSRWGSCNSKGHIMLNRRLYGAPQWVIDYVILHELCHLKFMGHHAQFWELLNSVDPNVAKAKQWLKHHQGTLMTIQL